MVQLCAHPNGISYASTPLVDNIPEWEARQINNTIKIITDQYIFADGANIDFNKLRNLTHKINAYNETSKEYDFVVYWN